MATCATCSAGLESAWKFCVYCGTPTIPGAIRPEPAPTDPPQQVNPLVVLALILGCLLGVLAAVAIVIVVVNSTA